MNDAIYTLPDVAYDARLATPRTGGDPISQVTVRLCELLARHVICVSPELRVPQRDVR
jgi:hypothetical protein